MSFLVADTHCDVLSNMVDHNFSFDGGAVAGDLSREGLLAGKVGLQVFAIWVGRAPRDHKDYCYRQLHAYYSMLSDQDFFIPFDGTLRQDRVSTLLALEGADFITDLAFVGRLAHFGVRIVTLVWNNLSPVGVPAVYGAGGLTDWGRDLVCELNRHKIAVDVSHLNEDGFHDVIQCSSLPAMASHSNARAVYDHPRNLRNGQIKALACSGGFIGLNFFPDHLGDASTAQFFRHMEHMLSLGAEDILGFGSDFDGISTHMDEVKGPQHFPVLIEHMLRMNYPEDLVRNICSGNFLHYLQQFS
ncbi:MAG: dipeptidase [Christensenellales bacterium]|jgi:membrane dipeptidase